MIALRVSGWSCALNLPAAEEKQRWRRERFLMQRSNCRHELLTLYVLFLGYVRVQMKGATNASLSKELFNHIVPGLCKCSDERCS